MSFADSASRQNWRIAAKCQDSGTRIRVMTASSTSTPVGAAVYHVEPALAKGNLVARTQLSPTKTTPAESMGMTPLGRLEVLPIVN